jgi:hypothetical protein
MNDITILGKPLDKLKRNPEVNESKPFLLPNWAIDNTNESAI